MSPEVSGPTKNAEPKRPNMPLRLGGAAGGCRRKKRLNCAAMERRAEARSGRTLAGAEPVMELRGSANLFYFTARRNLFNGQQRKDGTQRTVLWIRVHHGATEIGDCSKQLGGYIGPDVHFDLILGVDPR